ncbi:hypothetical protein [Labrys sp. ZIDIC5]|uniref:hypothetical protein n=1 Tax=Labrys sedimenti TaxID=3106036 RepID=UPI002ACA6021|nr:hypothetical protein [Labrys sp. ZIDIC5]MDZ5454617.1 hypothetical protein [Labrys sp. ZIDIC5]
MSVSFLKPGDYRSASPQQQISVKAAVLRGAFASNPLLAHAVIGTLVRRFRSMIRQVKN